MTGGAVELRAVTRRYRGVAAVDDVSLAVAAGEFVAVLGPSGSGKTTTMRLIGGFEHPDAGTVHIAGRDVTDVPASRRDVHTVFQSYGLFPHLSVVDNVAYALRMRGVRKAERRARAREALALVQLAGVDDRRPGQLSGGMQQRVALARALAGRPSVLLLDEPLGALDRKLREDMQVELRRIHREVGATFVYVTHDQEEALGMADRLVVMRGGRIEQLGAPGDVYDAPASLWTADFVGSSTQIPGTVAADAPGIVQTDVARLRVADPSALGAAGSRAVVVVRPEHVRVRAADAGEPPEPNRVRARVEETVLVGAQLKVVAVTPGGLRLTARVDRDGAAPGPGAEAWLSWPAERTLVFPAPISTDPDPGAAA
ncbi:ABC transporter ATP-binding protein [Patulibacter sp. SYSU D01012]|uniref:ABC transporter ATP-binding protein n=1 Tax=Patulibacter sp. SYSU D01012 TaxID=2817381 RepID=UPI001B303DFE|nr:ABC transporter ATP-binding protein [Patulibacter sp. SYSU D01012]